MKRQFLYAMLAVFLIPITIALATDYKATDMVYDKGRSAIQGFAPDPSRCRVPVSLGAGASTTINVTNWLAVGFRTSGAVRVHLNALPTKYMTFSADRHVFVIHPNVTSLTFTNAGEATINLEVWGM